MYSSILSSRCLLIRLRKLELRQKFDLTRAIVALILLLQGDKYSLLKTKKNVIKLDMQLFPYGPFQTP